MSNDVLQISWDVYKCETHEPCWGLSKCVYPFRLKFIIYKRPRWAYSDTKRSDGHLVKAVMKWNTNKCQTVGTVCNQIENQYKVNTPKKL